MRRGVSGAASTEGASLFIITLRPRVCGADYAVVVMRAWPFAGAGACCGVVPAREGGELQLEAAINRAYEVWR